MQNNKQFQSFESIEALATVNGYTARICSIYRPDPYGISVPIFIREFSDYLINISTKPHDVIVCGDINFHLDKPNDPSTIEFETVVKTCGYQQLIQQATHRNGHILDIVIAAGSTLVPESTSVTDLHISDHFWVEFHLKRPKPRPIIKRITCRKTKSIDHSAFTEDISKLDLDSPDISTLATRYDTGVATVFDRHGPETSKTIVVRPNTQWYNANLRHAKTVRRRLERRVHRTNSFEAKAAYRKQCDLVNHLRDKVKTEFISNRVLECGRDQKRLFTVMKGVLDWNKKPATPSNIPENALPSVLREFFLDKIIKIRNAISHDDMSSSFAAIRQNICSDLSDYNGSTLDQFRPATEDEIQRLIMSSPSSSCELDPVPTWLLKQCLPVFLPNLTRIVNLSLQNVDIPASLKRAIVRPLLKKASLDPDILKNYRPISNLSFLSKLIERLVAKRINAYLSTHALLDKFQSAYRMFHSTETALLRVHSDVLAQLDKRNMVAMVLLDLSAAFDTIDHAVLLERLNRKFGIRSLALAWLSSYLSNRCQCVVVNNTSSADATLKYGVPQGSVLGPLLFSLYVTPLADIAAKHGLLYHCYADDTQLCVAFNPNSSVKKTILNIEACISAVKQWMRSNLLKLNDDKTEFIIFASPYFSRKITSLSLTVGNNRTDSTPFVRNLGAIFDRKLSMENLVLEKVRTALFYLKNISRIRRYLDQESAKTIVHAFVISRLDYANSLLYNINANLLHRLQVVQNAAARIILNASRYDRATPFFNRFIGSLSTREFCSNV